MNIRFRLVLTLVVLLTTTFFSTLYVVQPVIAAQSENELTATPLQKPEIAPIEIPDNSVLNLIPESTLGIIYCPSLLELDERINAAASELMPQVGAPPELLAQILAESFGAGFESLADLEDIGLDLDHDFAVFITSLDYPPSLSAIVHLTDPEAMKQVIETETEESTLVEYKGITYWSSPEEGGNYVMLDNVLVFSQEVTVCETVIDISKGTMQSIAQNPNYTLFLTNIMKGTDQLAAYFDLESIIGPFTESFKEELQLTIDSLESDPAAMGAVPFLKNFFDGLIGAVEDLESVSVSLQVEGTDVQLAPFLKFKSNGEIQELLKEMAPDELVIINDMPNNNFIIGGFEGGSTAVVELGMSWLETLTENKAEQKKDFEELFQQFRQVFESIGDEWSFSLNFTDSFMPNVLIVVEMKDEQAVKTYMDEKFLDNINQLIQILKESVDDPDQLNLFDGVYFGNRIMHNGVEIKTITYPNFGTVFTDVPPEMGMLLPQEWDWSYAFSEGHLYFALGGAESIQSALDSKAKVGESISENQSYQKLVEKLGTKNNLLLGISPITMTKNMMDLTAKADPNAAAQMQMFMGILMGVTENYSISFSGKVRDGGIGGKLLITLGDFKQLIHTASILGMGM